MDNFTNFNEVINVMKNNYYLQTYKQKIDFEQIINYYLKC
jgi:hypothetical protein